MSYLIPILSQFENHYKMMLILAPGLILLVLAGAARLYADDHTKVRMQYMTKSAAPNGRWQNYLARTSSRA